MGRAIGSRALAEQGVPVVANLLVQAIARPLQPGQGPIGGHKHVAQRQQAPNFLSGVTALPPAIGGTGVNQNHTQLAVRGGDAKVTESRLVLHGDVGKPLPLI